MEFEFNIIFMIFRIVGYSSMIFNIMIVRYPSMICLIFRITKYPNMIFMINLRNKFVFLIWY
jgi:hypothetical protein